MVLIDVTSQSQIDTLKGVVVLNFWADWCKPCTQMNAIFDQLASQNPTITFAKVEAEKVLEVTEKYAVTSVPYFIMLNGGNIIDRVEGANPPELTKKVAKYSQQVNTDVGTTQPAKQNLNARLEKLINAAPVMLFMKGTPDQAKCGFSAKIVDILAKDGIEFSSFDILSDEEVRQGLKVFSNWPTYPQLYVQGKLIGGLDIVKELSEQGELKQLVPAEVMQQDLNSRLEKLINSAPVMLFMKGSPEQPKCGFSEKIAKVLKEAGVRYNSFNILSDEEVRQGLKTYSNWPTYPQVYINGKLIGGLDIVKELHEQGELKGMIPAESIQ